MSQLDPQTASEHNNRNISPMGEWALVHKDELAGLYNSFESAWSEAAIRFGRRRCIVRQISAFPMMLIVTADNLQTRKSKLLAPLQRWTSFFAAGEASS